MKKKIGYAALGLFLLALFAGVIFVRAASKNIPIQNMYGNAAVRAAENSDKPAKKNDSDAMKFSSRSVYLIDYNTGTELFERNSNQKLTIASMVKIMTLLLSFEAIDNGALTLDSEIQVSQNSADMGGSQVFLSAHSVHPVRNLLKAITVCSANDACVAMSEAIGGSEEVFVAKMNEKAKALGMNDTVFVNCTGLPGDGQHSTAKDVSKMFRELLKHKEYYEFTRVWLEEYLHPDGRKTEMTNTNKLIRFYKGCDAGKTGYTKESKYCLSASAVNSNMRVIAVVMGADVGQDRFEDTKKLFNYAFAHYENKKLTDKETPIENKIKVKGGKVETVRLTPDRDLYALNKKGGEGAKFSVEYELPDYIRAEVKKGQKIGKVTVKRNGETVGEAAAVAAEDIKKATIGDTIKKIIARW